MGRASGFNASGASQSIFQGYLSGHDATNSSYSIFQGANSGYSVIRPSTWIVDSRSTNVGTNGLIYGEFDNFRMSVNGTLSVRTNLIALQTASIPTNTASFDIDTTDFVMNKRYTNDNRRASVVTCLHMAPSATDAASVGLYIDQNHDGSYDTQILSEVAGGPSSPAEHHPITGWIQPGGIFVFTNLSSGTAAATIHSGSSQYVRQ